MGKRYNKPGVFTVRNRLWVLPAVVCLGLLVAWLFRWERGPVQKQSGVYEGTVWAIEIHHLRDRWTGQAWVALYGNDPKEKKWYSGEVRPVPSQVEVAKRKEQVLERPEQKARREALNSQIAECNRMKSLYEEAQRSYEKANRLGNAESLTPEIIQAHRRWKEIDTKAELLAAELADLERGAEETAISELKHLAWQKQKLATVVWGGLVVISAVAACVMYFSRGASGTH